MLIDWFTVAAQVINFIVLVWLLKRFLYKPILNAIDLREKRIAAESAASVGQSARAQQLQDEFAQKSRAFDAERDALLVKAGDEAKAERTRLLHLAEKEAGDLVSQRLLEINDEKADRNAALRRMAAAEVYAVSRKTLTDLSSTGLEERMVDTFIQRLGMLTPEAKAAFAAALGTHSRGASVCTRFELNSAEKAALQQALNVTFSAAVDIAYVTDPAVICGIEIQANGQKMAWSIADYLTTLEQKIDVLQDAGPTPTPQSALLAVAP